MEEQSALYLILELPVGCSIDGSRHPEIQVTNLTSQETFTVEVNEPHLGTQIVEPVETTFDTVARIAGHPHSIICLIVLGVGIVGITTLVYFKRKKP